jgi:hypothetical protein
MHYRLGRVMNVKGAVFRTEQGSSFAVLTQWNWPERIAQIAGGAPLKSYVLLSERSSALLLRRNDHDAPTAAELVQVVTVRLHHFRPFRDALRAVVNSADLVPVHVRQLQLNIAAVVPELMQQRRCRGSKAARCVNVGRVAERPQGRVQRILRQRSPLAADRREHVSIVADDLVQAFEDRHLANALAFVMADSGTSAA